jgi:hypothetical protein
MQNYILTFVLYRKELGLPQYGEQHRPWVFENWVLREILEPKRKEVVGDWRRLHNEELHNLYDSPDLIRIFPFSCDTLCS